MQYLAQVGAWLTSGQWYPVFLGVRAFFVVMDIALVALLIFVLQKALEYRPRFYWSPRIVSGPGVKRDPELVARWDAILRKAPANPPHSYTLAIIEADKVTDEALKRLGFEGEHMADRLEKLNARGLSSLEELWRAHRLRNELVHTPDFEVSAGDAERTLAVYEKFLKEVGVL